MSTVSTVRFVLLVLALYTALRVFSTGVLLWITYAEQDPLVFDDDQPRYFSVTTLWDGRWYERIATGGYPEELPVDSVGEVRQNEWAFYPLFPLLSRGLMALTGLPFAVAGTLLATGLGYAAVLVIAGLLRERVGAPGALAGVALLGSFPAAPVLQVAYTESLALLLLGAALWLMVRRRWLPAAAVVLLTGLARPIALPLGLVAVVAVLYRWWGGSGEPPGRSERLGMVAAVLACGVSGLLWPALAWAGTGRMDAYPATMSAWRAGETVTPFAPTLEVARLVLGETRGPWLLGTAGVLLVVAVLGPWAAGLGVEMRAWSLAYPLYLAAALDPWTSIYRYLLLLFPVFVIAVGAGWPPPGPRRPQPDWVLWVRTAVLTSLFLGWQVWWSWELFMFVPPRDNPP
jgi:hypothetical protein